MPKPHTPFQWAAQLDHETTDARLRKLRDAIRADRGYGKAIGFRYHDGKPGIIEGLLSRGDRRVGAVIRAVWRDGGAVRRLERALLVRALERRADEALAGEPVDLDWYTTRERDYDEVLPVGPPRLRPRQGLALGGLAGRARPRREVEDCRWTPCFDCGVCPTRWAPRSRSARPARRCCRSPSSTAARLPRRAGAAALIRRLRMSRRPDGPPPAARPVQRLRLRYAKRGRLRFASHRDFQRAFERALRRAGVPMAYSAGFTPHPKISYANAAPTGAASEAEYLEIARDRARATRASCAQRSTRRCRTGSTCSRWSRSGTGALADRLEASEWQIVLPGVEPTRRAAAVAAFLAAERGRGRAH